MMRYVAAFAAAGFVLGLGMGACAKGSNGEKNTQTGEKAPRTRTETPKATKGVRCQIPAGTLAQIKAASGRLEVSEASKSAWFGLMVRRCSGWPVALKLQLQIFGPMPRGEKLSLPNVTKAQYRELDQVMDQMCPGSAKRFKSALKKGPLGPSPGLWEHCGFARWRVLSRREWAGGWMRNTTAMLLYRLLADGGLEHPVARTLARLMAVRGRWSSTVKEGEMMLPPSVSRTEAVRNPEVTVAASGIYIEKKRIARVKNGRVDVNTKRDGPDGHFIDPLFVQLKARLKVLRAAAKKAGQPLVPQLTVFAHKGTPFRLVTEVLYSSLQAGFVRFQLAVNSDTATDAAVVVEVTIKTKHTPPSASPARVRLDHKAYVIQNRGGGVASTHKAFPFKSAAARVAVAKALYARLLKSKQSGKTRGVIHLRVADTIPYSDVILLLDALRVKPGAAGKGGCRLVLDPKRSTWSPAPAAKRRCMLYRPRLQLLGN